MEQVLSNKNRNLLLTGQFISLLGNSIQRFALSLYILDLTGSVAAFSALTAFSVLPQIFISPVGGAIADLADRKKMLIVLDLISAGMLALLLGSLKENPSSIISLAVFMLLLATIGTVYDPVIRAVIPSVVRPQEYMKTNSYVSAISSVTLLGGSVGAGFLYAFFGIRIIIIINLISFLCSAILELFLQLPNVNSQDEKISALKIFSDMKESLIFMFREQKLIFYVLLLSAAVNLFMTPIYSIGIASVLKLTFHVSNQTFGIVQGIVGSGMVAGALMTPKISKRIPVEKMHVYFYAVSFAILGMGCSTSIFINPSAIMKQMAVIIFVGMGFLYLFLIAIINISFFTVVQKNIPLSMMGKIMALIMSICSAFTPIGQILYGFWFDQYADHLIIIYIFAIVCTVILGAILGKILKRYHPE
ncbi:MAG: MFS transporter [Butyrivibrio sp.]|nr:MFS transporter [Butyrivibrio sp.]